KTKATKGKSKGLLYKVAGRFQQMRREQVSSKRHPRDQKILACKGDLLFEPAYMPILFPLSDLAMEEGRKRKKEDGWE
ncbi:hypothetical protein, partial [Staphylococcus nepalensis]|uniref:hypothetical protein n=1 Tax=Staphylococcus nepalensis TaxID=214473 RepID=UPI00285970AA